MRIVPGTSTSYPRWNLSNNGKTVSLLFLFGRFAGRLLYYESFHAFEFRFETGHEIVRSVLEEDDKTEGEENK
jgi:hypothetical protein